MFYLIYHRLSSAAIKITRGRNMFIPCNREHQRSYHCRLRGQRQCRSIHNLEREKRRAHHCKWESYKYLKGGKREEWKGWPSSIQTWTSTVEEHKSIGQSKATIRLTGDVIMPLVPGLKRTGGTRSSLLIIRLGCLLNLVTSFILHQCQ